MRVVKRPGFPPHVAELEKMRAWYRSDVEAHHAGKPFPARTPSELNPQLMTSSEIHARLGGSPARLRTYIHERNWDRVPRPAGQVARVHYWLRDEAERWFEEHADLVARNKARDAQAAETSR